MISTGTENRKAVTRKGGNGQAPNRLLGKILRIDVDNGDPYAIPEGNLFKGSPDKGREEIYAMGIRNPWGMTVDIDGKSDRRRCRPEPV